MEIPQPKIEMVKLVEIKPYEKNAKKHPKKQVEAIAESIRNFGFLVPGVITKDGELIAGHGRHLAAQLLELAEMPVIRAEHLSAEAIKAYRLADNKLAESEWDMSLVVAELKDLSLPMLDLTGFSRDLILDNDDKDDVVPEAPTTPKSKAGDLYQLGRHRLIVGDSTNPDTYEKVRGGGGVQADMVFTDPPYNVNYKGRGENTDRTIANDHMEASAFDAFLSGFFMSAVSMVKGGAGWYIFHSSSSQDAFKRALEEAGLAVRAQLIWNKPTASMGWGDYRWKHEPFFYAGKKETELVFYGDRTHSTVIDFHKSEKELIEFVKREKRLEVQGLSSVWTMKRDKVNQYQHPTQKPVELITYAIVNSSKAGDIVLDPFCGSGSTLIACEKTDRVCFGIELDPTFADVIVQRFVDFTNGKVPVIKNGVEEQWKVSSNFVLLADGESDQDAEAVTTEDAF